MKDELYYVALRNADRYQTLTRRAERVGDDELAEFFRAMRDDGRRNAEKVKRLLAQRLAE